MMHSDRRWEEIEPTLGEGWAESRGSSKSMDSMRATPRKTRGIASVHRFGQDVLRDDIH